MVLVFSIITWVFTVCICSVMITGAAAACVWFYKFVKRNLNNVSNTTD
jgi:hypothetical protein